MFILIKFIYVSVNVSTMHSYDTLRVYPSLLQKKALASDLYEQVFYSLDLIEKDYFGLQYTDSNNVQHWLDPTKRIKKQVKSTYFQILLISY